MTSSTSSREADRSSTPSSSWPGKSSSTHSEHSARTWDSIDDLSGNIDTEEAIQYILLERKETIDDLTEMIEDERNTEEDEEYIEEYKNVLRKMGVEISD